MIGSIQERVAKNGEPTRQAFDDPLGVVSAFLAYTSVILILLEKDLGTTLFGDVPTWPFQVILPVGFTIMTFRFLIKAAVPTAPATEEREGEAAE